MISLKSTFVIFYQKDHDDRERNLHILLNFLNRHYSDIEIIVIQQFKNETERSNFKLDPIFQNKIISHHILPEDTENWNKMMAYNLGLKCAKYDTVFFNDVDIIFRPSNLEKAFNLINDCNKILIPSNSYFVDVKLPLIEKFKTILDYEYLLTEYNKFNKTIRSENKYFKNNNIGGPGGGIAGKKQTFISMNGFNPNFTGWGFEDDEFIHRFRELGNRVEFIKDGDPMFHMSHEGARRGSSGDNREKLNKIMTIESDKLLEYSNSWKL
jgi:predicted glycosyltransferase involved in capsule biosynthesis